MFEFNITSKWQKSKKLHFKIIQIVRGIIKMQLMLQHSNHIAGLKYLKIK